MDHHYESNPESEVRFEIESYLEASQVPNVMFVTYSSVTSDIFFFNRILCLCRNNETAEWIDSHISAASDVWTIVNQLQPYTQYQFQLLMHNDSVLQSDWITTDMDGINNILLHSKLTHV